MTARGPILLGMATVLGCATPATVGGDDAAGAASETASPVGDASLLGADQSADTNGVASPDGLSEINAEVVKTYDAIASTSITKDSTTALYKLTLTGPMKAFVGQNVSMTLVIGTTGPVKFINPVVTFQKALTGDKPLKTPVITVDPLPLTWTISDLVPSSPGTWKLHIALGNGDAADFDMTVAP